MTNKTSIDNCDCKQEHTCGVFKTFKDETSKSIKNEMLRVCDGKPSKHSEEINKQTIEIVQKCLDLYKQKILGAYTIGFSDLVHPEFCKQSGEQFNECAKCRADSVKQIIENI